MPRRKTFDEQFWPKVEVHVDGCWLWTGASRRDGYGNLHVGGRLGKSVSAHRVLYERVYGPIPSGLELDHLCRVRLCVRPDHLEPVTHAENAKRGLAGAHMKNPRLATAFNRNKTHCPQGHPYTEENTLRGTLRLKSGNEGTYRRCRICAKAADARRRERQKQAGVLN